MQLPIGEILIYGLMLGAVFGLLGAGGSILIWPLLAMVLGHTEQAALAESFAIVGGIGGAGAASYLKRQEVDYRLFFWVGFSSCLGSSLGALLGHTGNKFSHYLLFMCIAWIAGFCMLKLPRESLKDDLNAKKNPLSSPQLMLLGLGVGLCSGLTSIGGGFLLVPAFVLLCHMPMHLAVGTSLMVITCNALSGFTTLCIVCGKGLIEELHYEVIFLCILFGTLGTLLSSFYAKKIPQTKLRHFFAFFLFLFGAFLGFKALQAS